MNLRVLDEGGSKLNIFLSYMNTSASNPISNFPAYILMNEVCEKRNKTYFALVLSSSGKSFVEEKLKMSPSVNP
jgi:hypothetical protein